LLRSRVRKYRRDLWITLYYWKYFLWLTVCKTTKAEILTQPFLCISILQRHDRIFMEYFRQRKQHIMYKSICASVYDKGAVQFTDTTSFNWIGWIPSKTKLKWIHAGMKGRHREREKEKEVVIIWYTRFCT